MAQPCRTALGHRIYRSGRTGLNARPIEVVSLDSARGGGPSPGHVDCHRQAGSIAERACGVTATGGILH
jgi:hypothetical protein